MNRTQRLLQEAFEDFNNHSIECGVPIVTLEGKFLRGKFASAILKRISLNLVFRIYYI
jgi:hypothetical protein